MIKYIVICDHMSSGMIMCDHMWPKIVRKDYIWSYTIRKDNTLSSMVIHCHISSHMIIYYETSSYILSYMIMHDHVGQKLAYDCAWLSIIITDHVRSDMITLLEMNKYDLIWPYMIISSEMNIFQIRSYMSIYDHVLLEVNTFDYTRSYTDTVMLF